MAPLTELEISALVQRYARERDRFEKMASTVGRVISARLRDSTIPHVPTFRSKDPESLRRKLRSDREKHEFRSFESEFAPSVLDLAGVRVLLYRPQDIEPTCKLVDEIFDIPNDQRFRRDHDKPSGYRARHRVARLRGEHLGSDPALKNLVEVMCEIQVATLVDHIWNELEHDIKYKTPAGPPSPVQDALLGTLRNQLTSVDAAVVMLMNATEQQQAKNLKSIESVDDLRLALIARCGRVLRGDFERCRALLQGVLRELTIARLADLPLGPAELETASGRLAAAGNAVADDDVALVMAALWPTFTRDFVEIADSWLGRRGPFSRALRALDAASQKGKI